MIILLVITAGVCFGAIFLWEKVLYENFSTWSSGNKALIKLMSGGYFLVIALFTFYGIWPLAASLLSGI